MRWGDDHLLSTQETYPPVSWVPDHALWEACRGICAERKSRGAVVPEGFGGENITLYFFKLRDIFKQVKSLDIII